MSISLQSQEYFGWAGNAIFVFAQIFQIVHTHKIKTTRDISYGLQILFFIGDLMFTIFGAIDKSWSMFIGNGVSTFFCMIQIGQKIYYDRYYNGYQRLDSVYPKIQQDLSGAQFGVGVDSIH